MCSSARSLLAGARRLRALALAAAIVAAIAPSAVTPAGAAARTIPKAMFASWGPAVPLKGFAPNNLNGFVGINDLSCPRPSNCDAVVTFPLSAVGPTNDRAFLLAERAGTWGHPEGVPGMAALSSADNASLWSISCPSVGNCAAAGTYTQAGALQGFVVDETNGSWGQAEAIPGLSALNVGGQVSVFNVSCGAVGDCAVVGNYFSNQEGTPFVANEVHGVWGTAQVVPGVDTLAGGRSATLDALTCAGPGSCATTGTYTDASGVLQEFAIQESGHSWGAAQRVGVLDTNSNYMVAEITVACAKPGYCALAGTYANGKDVAQVFVAPLTGGVVGRAEAVPGLGRLSYPGNEAQDLSLSCPAVGSCDLVGGEQVPYVVEESRGVWGRPARFPGVRVLTGGHQATISAASCGAVGDCAAVGYLIVNNTTAGFVVDEHGGSWGRVELLRGTSSALGAPTDVGDVTCVGPVSCTATGYYINDAGTATTGFVASQS